MAVQTKKSDDKSSVTPFIIIGIIFAATIVGIYAISQSGGDKGDENTNSGTSNGQSATDSALEAYANAPAGAVPANSLGPDNAPVVVEEFADFQCPTCGVVHPKIKEVVSHFGGKIKFVFRNYPLIQAHPNAYDAAVACEAAGAQGKFWQMQDMIFANQGNWSAMPNARSAFKEYAGKIGLDVAKFEDDILAMPTKLRVDADMERGRKLNIQSTPTILINGKPVPFSQVEVETLKTLIDAELAKTNTAKDASK